MSLWSRVCSGRLGAGWMVVAALFFSLLGLFVKLGGALAYSPVELLFYRTLTGAVLLAAAMRTGGVALWPQSIGGHVRRTLVGYVSMTALFHAVTHLPLATAITLNYTSSLFFALVCIVMLRERPRPVALLALLLGFCGIVLLLHPSLQGDQIVPAFIGLFSGVTAGMAVYQVRELGIAGEDPRRIVFWFFAFSTVIGFFIVQLQGGFHPVRPADLPVLAGIGLSGLAGQLAMTRAYKEGRKFLVASFAYLTVAFSALIGHVLWHEPLGLAQLFPMGMIVLSGVLAARR